MFHKTSEISLPLTQQLVDLDKKYTETKDLFSEAEGKLGVAEHRLHKYKEDAKTKMGKFVSDLDLFLPENVRQTGFNTLTRIILIEDYCKNGENKIVERNWKAKNVSSETFISLQNAVEVEQDKQSRLRHELDVLEKNIKKLTKQIEHEKAQERQAQTTKEQELILARRNQEQVAIEQKPAESKNYRQTVSALEPIRFQIAPIKFEKHAEDVIDEKVEKAFDDAAEAAGKVVKAVARVAKPVTSAGAYVVNTAARVGAQVATPVAQAGAYVVKSSLNAGAGAFGRCYNFFSNGIKAQFRLWGAEKLTAYAKQEYQRISMNPGARDLSEDKLRELKVAITKKILLANFIPGMTTFQKETFYLYSSFENAVNNARAIDFYREGQNTPTGKILAGLSEMSVPSISPKQK